MALLDSEVARIKYELGYNVLAVGAEPYIGVAAVFNQVIQAYMTSGAATTSSTAVTAADTPTPVTLTLASGTGFVAGARVIIDVDDRQEAVIAQAVSGASLTVLLTSVHSGTYPVTVEGGESLVREILRHLWKIGGPGGELEMAMYSAGIKKVDEVEFFGKDESSMDPIRQLRGLRDYWRDELASLLGVANLHAAGRGCVELY